jgi:hypothetical protein
MGRRYQALRSIAFMYKAFGVVAFVFGVIGAIGAFGAAGGLSSVSSSAQAPTMPLLGVLGIPTAIGSLVIGVLAALTLFAAAEGILVILDIEENTRAMAFAAQQPGMPADLRSYPSEV